MDNNIKRKNMYSLIKGVSDKKLYISNDHLCNYCKQKYYNRFSDKFFCHYCGKYFCSNHRLPEHHQCNQEIYKLKSPPTDVVVRYKGETTEIIK